MSNGINLEPSWLNELHKEFSTPNFLALKNFLQSEKTAGKRIYPPGNQIFAALNHTAFNDVKVVIIGQDPYHGPNQAHGLCFSVKEGVSIPPSLRNIYREIQSEYKDLGVDWSIPETGFLQHWADQGVLMLNAVLTVEAGKAGSHHSKGWEPFTDAIIDCLNQKKEELVFLLWGGYAKKKGRYIDRNKHLVLESGHPSPLSANKGHWFGNGHFIKTNQYLSQKRVSTINW